MLTSLTKIFIFGAIPMKLGTDHLFWVLNSNMLTFLTLSTSLSLTSLTKKTCLRHLSVDFGTYYAL